MDLALEEGTLDCYKTPAKLLKERCNAFCLAGMDATFGLVDLGNSCCQAVAAFGGTSEHLLETF